MSRYCIGLGLFSGIGSSTRLSARSQSHCRFLSHAAEHGNQEENNHQLLHRTMKSPETIRSQLSRGEEREPF